MKTTEKINKQVIDFVAQLSKVKKEIGEKFISGIKRSKLETQYRDAFVTMVWQDITAIDTKWYDGKVYDIKLSGTKSDYSIGKGKKNMRGKVLTEVVRSAKNFKITKGLVLTLSCFECFMERGINKLFKGFKFIPYECETTHFDLLKNKIKTDKLNFMLTPVFGRIIEGIRKAKKDTYSHLLLDFCQTLPTHTEDIETALKNDIVKKGGIVWLTVSNRLGKGFKGYNTQDKLIALIEQAGGDRYEYDKQIFPLNYNDDGGMTSIILRRIK